MATGFTIKDALNKNSKAGIDETPKARFRTKDISIFKIYANKENFYPQEEIEQKAGEILAIGLLENLVVSYKPNNEREYELISGERRWRALNLLVERGYKEFECATCKVIAPTTPQEEKINMIMANSQRNKSIAVMIEEERELKESLEYMKTHKMVLKGYDLQSGRLRETIASILRLSKTKVAQIETVNNNLIAEWKKELKEERLTFSAAYELSGMTAEEQREILTQYIENGEISYKKIKKIKENKEKKREEAEKAQLPGQMSMKEVQQSETDAAEHKVSESDTKKTRGIEETGEIREDAAVQEYETPHPEGITSLCYSCTEYETCNVKTGTCTKCDQYKNRAEVYKTEEQRYSEEQDAIDRETAKKLREQAENEKINNLPSDNPKTEKTHNIKIGATFFEDVVNRKKTFELRKNDRNYKKGDILEMSEYKDGKKTGRRTKALVTYMLEEYEGLEEGYCIMGISVITSFLYYNN